MRLLDASASKLLHERGELLLALKHLLIMLPLSLLLRLHQLLKLVLHLGHRRLQLSLKSAHGLLDVLLRLLQALDAGRKMLRLIF